MILHDYFDKDRVYDAVYFKRRYRIPHTVFNWVYKFIEKLLFFFRKSDALGAFGIHPLQRVTAAIRMMGLGVAADAIDEYFRILESSVIE